MQLAIKCGIQTLNSAIKTHPLVLGFQHTSPLWPKEHCYDGHCYDGKTQVNVRHYWGILSNL